MARKRRNLPQHPRPQSATTQSPSDLDHKKSKIQDFDLPPDASIRLECQKAFFALRHGNNAKAIKLIKDLCLGNPNSAIVHRVQGAIFVRIASKTDKTSIRRKNVDNAVESACRAVSLCPNSVEFAYFHAMLLFEIASNQKGHEEVMRECERALAIENPIDPGIDSLLEDSELKDSSKEERIAKVRDEVEAILKDSAVTWCSDFSDWKKTVANDIRAEKLRLMKIGQFIEFPKTVRSEEKTEAGKSLEETTAKLKAAMKSASKLLEKWKVIRSEDSEISEEKSKCVKSFTELRAELEARVKSTRELLKKWNAAELENKEETAEVESFLLPSQIKEKRKQAKLKKIVPSADRIDGDHHNAGNVDFGSSNELEQSEERLKNEAKIEEEKLEEILCDESLKHEAEIEEEKLEETVNDESHKREAEIEDEKRLEQILEDERLKREAEIEEEKKLEECLENQRKYENEAKQTRLSEQMLELDDESLKHQEEIEDEKFLEDEGIKHGAEIEDEERLEEILEDERLKREAEIEEAKKLEECLENQWQYEKEAKQDRLAEQNKKTKQTQSDGRLHKGTVQKYIWREKIRKAFPEEDETRALQTDRTANDENVADVFATGPKNDFCDYNFFLDVIIQSLWHLRRFRDEFLSPSPSPHSHVGEPCVVCALYSIFTSLDKASKDMSNDYITPTTLRTALSNFQQDTNFFQEGQMNHAPYILGLIFKCLHWSSESEETELKDFWDCESNSCLVHTLFRIDYILERVEDSENCDLEFESSLTRYTSFSHNLDANEIIETKKSFGGDITFSEILRFVQGLQILVPDSEGFNKLIYLNHLISNQPHIFTAVLEWSKSAVDISETLEVFPAEMDISSAYGTLKAGRRYCLISMICYSGLHYICFAFSYERENWILYDNKTEKVVGCWDDVRKMCGRERFQPHILFFEVN